MQTSDATTIVDNSKVLADRLFKAKTPQILANVDQGLNSGIMGLNSGIAQIDQAIASLQQAYDGVSNGIVGMEATLVAQKAELPLAAFQKLTAKIKGGFIVDTHHTKVGAPLSDDAGENLAVQALEPEDKPFSSLRCRARVSESVFHLRLPFPGTGQSFVS